MTHRIFTSVRLVALLAALLSFHPGFARSAEAKAVRIAIGPFFAPAANDELRNAGKLIPELLTVEMSQATRFQLVEREKILNVWSELNLSSASLVARDNVAKLGRVLACDWLISGSLVQANGHTHVWTKVIDVRNGVVVDLNVTPYERGVVTNVVSQIAAFLNQTGSKPKGRQFVVMDSVVDMNPPHRAKREDWSKRLQALMEKHFLDSGFGVAELAAIGPIFEERRLEAAGLTGNLEGRVKLQSAFWLVDGGCEWVEGQPPRLAVGLRVQRIGGPPQIFRFTNSPNEAVEKDLIAALAAALRNTNTVAKLGPNAEADLLAARGMEKAELRSPFPLRMSQPRNEWEGHKQQIEHRKRLDDNRRSLIANYERTLLREPGNREAKLMLGYGLFGDPDPQKHSRGKELLREVIATKDPKYAQRALQALTNEAMFVEMGKQRAGPPPRPKDWNSLNRAYEENPSDQEAKYDLGAALLGLPRVSQRERGRKMLQEIAASDNPDQAERARKRLAEPEKYPAIQDDPPERVAAEEARLVAQEEEHYREDSTTAARREHFQANFDKFVPVKFEFDGLEFAQIQTLSIQKNKFDYDGKHYCGFRFVVPPWFDGDFTWMYILAKTEAQKEFFAEGFEWYIVPRSGKMAGFDNYQTLEVAKYPGLKKRFPHTMRFICQYLPKRRLKAGQEYAIWFGFNESNLPDISFALTISSERGQKEVGELPVR